MRTCSIHGCNRGSEYRKYCPKHRYRIEKHGDPNTSLYDRDLSPKQRILKHIIKTKCPNPSSLKIHNTKNSKCWVWSRGTDVGGYGKFKINCKQHKTHRMSYQIFVGEIPKGKFVLHKCDNPPCCNPKHLFIGSQADNVKDRDNKNRGYDRRGEKHPQSKLTEEDIREIRRLYSTGYYYQKDLGKAFGITQAIVSKIHKRQIWSHI